MAEDSDGQQITVAELLKRMGAEQQDAPSGRRRRRAEEGGVSVSELTGEIPRITDETVLSGRAARRRAREAEESQAAGQDARGEQAAPRTGAQPGKDAQAEAAGTPPVVPAGPADAKAQPSAATTATLPAQTPPAAPASLGATPGQDAEEAAETQKKSGRRGLFGRKHKGAESSEAESGAPRSAAPESATAKTGAAAAATTGVASAADQSGAAEQSDAAAQTVAGTQTAPGAKGGAADQVAPGAQPAPAAKADSPAATGKSAAPGPAASAVTARTVRPTQAGPGKATEPAASGPTSEPSSAPESSPAAESGPPQAWGVPSGSGSTAHRAPEGPVETGAPTQGRATADSQTEGAAQDAGTDGRQGPLGAAAAAAAGGAGVAGMTAAALSGGEHAGQPRAEEVETTRFDAPQATVGETDTARGDLAPAGRSESEPYRDVDPDAADDAPERSGATQWLILIAQVLASAVAGAALFIGFQLLWGDLPWVAFALAIIVIVGLVAMVRVLRRSNDSVSIALAVIVGLGVTCGPLLLRLVT